MTADEIKAAEEALVAKTQRVVPVNVAVRSMTARSQGNAGEVAWATYAETMWLPWLRGENDNIPDWDAIMKWTPAVVTPEPVAEEVPSFTKRFKKDDN